MSDILIAQEVGTVVVIETAPAEIVEVVAVGPQGPVGDVNPQMPVILAATEAARDAALASELAAADSQSAAATSAANAATSESNAATSAATATAQATASAGSATDSAGSAAAAQASATNAATSETNAANSATASANSATSSANSATAAQAAQTATESARDTALASEQAAAASQSAAATSAANAATSESNAATSAATATAQATASADSAGASAASAAASQASAANAAASESNAAASATASANSATSSANSATAAQAARTATESARDTTLATVGTMVLKANNLSDLASIPTALVNLGLNNVSNTSDANKPVSTAMQAALDLKENAANKGVANGYAGLDAAGKVPANQLPSYVDDVLEFANLVAFPATGEAGKIYVALDTNKTYRWSGSAYVEISALSGTPTAPTAANGTNNTQIATTAFVLATRLDQLAAPTADVSMNSRKITGLAEPVGSQDAATKNYVDMAVQGLTPKQSVKAATTANIASLSGTMTIDGIALVAGDRILVKDQTTASQNGIYVVQSGAWTRADDASTWAELVSAYVFVEQGTTNADNGFLCTSDQGGTLGSTAITFVQFSGAGSGDVVGPNSSTDNAIARFDLATGKLIQNSSATVDDSGNINALTMQASGTGANKMPVGTTAQRPATPSAGMYRMNSTTGVPEYYDTSKSLWLPMGSNLYSVEYLVVAGGGGGANGGGGAGGFISGSTQVSSNQAFSLTIGAGGAGVTSGNQGNDGSSTTAFGQTAIGGGGGGGGGSVSPTGRNGGSGGGGGTYNANQGGSGTSGQGNSGGSGNQNTFDNAGGGGGANAAGSNAISNTQGGAGGAGKQWVDGNYYAGGGGGGTQGSSYSPAAGGIGGGGNGNTRGGAGAVSGTANTGGGGGGGMGTAGNGGSGVVIVRYAGTQRGTGGTVTYSGGYTIHTFTTSGTYTA